MADLIVPADQVQTETVVASWEAPASGTWTIPVQLSLSMYLMGRVKSVVARVRDPRGEVLGSYVFGAGQPGRTSGDGSDSADGVVLGTWEPDLGELKVDVGEVFTVTVQSNNGASPNVYSAFHSIGGGVLLVAVKARDDVTLANITDVANVRRYYLLQSSTLEAPTAPTVNPAPSPWVTTEPTYTEGSTNTLYTVDLTVFSDGSFDYSPVSKSSSYEAAKTAYNKALAANATANAALAAVPPFVQQATPSATVVGQLWYPIDSSGRIIGMKRASTTGTTGWQDYLMMAGQVLVPGTVGTTEIGPDGVLSANIRASNELWTKVLAVAGDATIGGRLLANNIITGSMLADVIELATRLVAGNPDGTRVELDGTGLTVYRTSVDGDVLPAIRLGLAGESDFFGILDTSGGTLSSLDEDGNITGQTLNANEGITLAGQDLAETLASMPQGVLAWSRLAEDMIFSTNWARLVFASIEWQPGRLYRISTTVQFDSTSNTIKVALRQNAGSSVSGANTIRRSWSLPASRSSFPATAAFEHYVNSDDLGLTEGDPVTFGIFARTTSGNARVLTTGSSVDSTAITDMVIEDLGAAAQNVVTPGFPNTSGGSGSDTDTTTTKRTKTYSATACQSYLGSGAKYAYNVGKAYQGTYGSNSTLHSLWVFPSVISDLSGATVNKVVLRITNNHTVANAGGTARIQTHGQTGVPATYTGGSTVANVYFSKGQTKDIDLTSVAAAGLKSGTIRGFGLHSNAASDYGYWSGAAQLIITYTK